MTNMDLFANIKLDGNGNLPYRVFRDGVCYFLYMIEEKIEVDNNGEAGFVTIYQEKAYFLNDGQAREWYQNHPRHYSKREDYPCVELLYLQEPFYLGDCGIWQRVYC